MKVIICVDYSSYTEKVLQAAKLLLGTRVPSPQISVVHIIDQTLLSATRGEEMNQRLNELKNDGQKILKLAGEYLGEGFYYIEETGIPKAEIDEILKDTPHDLLVIGTRGRSLIAGILLGSIAEHLLHTSEQPLLIVP